MVGSHGRTLRDRRSAWQASIEQMFYHFLPPPGDLVVAASATVPPYAELHCHSHFSFLDGASAPDDLVDRAIALGLSALALTDHQGLYGAVRFSTAAESAGLHPVIGVEVELLDAAAPDPGALVVPGRRPWRPGGRRRVAPEASLASTLGGPIDGFPARPRPERARLPGHRRIVK